jgi:iron complex transport system substrate-binding protein
VKYRLIIAVTLFSLALTACAGVPVLAPEGSAGKSVSSSAAFTVVDSRDRTVHFERPPERILVSGKANLMILEAIYMFETASEHVPAFPKAGQRQAQSEAFLSLVDPAYEEKPQFQWSATAEQLASLNPDVVLLKSFMADQVGQALEELGIPVVYVDFETPEQYRRDLEILARLLDEEDRLDEILTYYDFRQERVTETVGDLTAAEKPSVLLLQYSDKGGEVAFNVPPSTWIQTTLVELAGGNPMWTDASQGKGWTVVNFEQIAAWNPDKIFVVNYFSGVDSVVDGLKDDPQWQNLKAVQGGELYGFPKDFYSWDQPDPRWILGLSWLAKTMHPSRFSDLDMNVEVFTFFEEMYGLEESVIEESILPRLQGDWQ